MLVLSRKCGEKVVIGDGITLTVVEVKGNQVRIGIEAPDDVRILRAELAFCQNEPSGDGCVAMAEPIIVRTWDVFMAVPEPEPPSEPHSGGTLFRFGVRPQTQVNKPR